jgi:hypothetical protein
VHASRTRSYREAVSDPRKHHFVAQVYQRGFARRKGKSFQVRVLNKRSGEGGIRNVRDAFSRRDWNTIKTEEGLKEFGVERVLAEHIDAQAAPALEATREHQFPLSRPDREALAMFMSAQLSRGRAVREGLAESIVEVNRLLLRLGAVNYSDERLREITGQEPSAELREMMANSEKYVEIQPTNAMLLQAMFSSVQEIAEMIDRRTWTLVRFDSPCLFTGEHPFVPSTRPANRSGSASRRPSSCICRHRLPRPWCSPIRGRAGPRHASRERWSWRPDSIGRC